MPRLSVKCIPMGNPYYFRNVLNYVAKKEKCSKPFIGASNVYLPMMKKEIVPSLEEQIHDLRVFYGKTDKRLGIHFEINFSPEEAAYLNPVQILEVGYWISEMEFTGCMTYFAVHDHSKLLHLDMLIIPIRITEGTMYGCNRAGWHSILKRLNVYLRKYIPEYVELSEQVVYPE